MSMCKSNDIRRGEIAASVRMRAHEAQLKQEAAADQSRLTYEYKSEVLTMKAQASNVFESDSHELVTELREHVTEALFTQDDLRSERTAERARLLSHRGTFSEWSVEASTPTEAAVGQWMFKYQACMLEKKRWADAHEGDVLLRA